MNCLEQRIEALEDSVMVIKSEGLPDNFVNMNHKIDALWAKMEVRAASMQNKSRYLE